MVISFREMVRDELAILNKEDPEKPGAQAAKKRVQSKLEWVVPGARNVLNALMDDKREILSDPQQVFDHAAKFWSSRFAPP